MVDCAMSSTIYNGETVIYIWQALYEYDDTALCIMLVLLKLDAYASEALCVWQ